MQIDFHHTTTYAVARLAGFSDAEANIIAYSAQYVDDSTTEGFIEFRNGMRYQRFATAHPPTDFQNATNNNENALSWLPFHFLPGNSGLPAGEGLDLPYEERLICLPDSPVAKAMMASVIQSKSNSWGLHRLGIAAHVFVDTFAHQEFVGLNHPLNGVKNNIQTAAGAALRHLTLPPVGHGQVDTYPDRPYLEWQYTKANGKLVKRNNSEIFTLAAERLYEEFQRYQMGEPDGVVPPMGKADRNALKEMFINLDSDNEKQRHGEWIAAIQRGQFSFGRADVSYAGSGQGSWKHQALGDSFLGWFQGKVESANANLGAQHNIAAEDVETFMGSDYKNFHDAERAHRHLMLTEIFPAFGLYVG